jgi:hypothetical protein
MTSCLLPCGWWALSVVLCRSRLEPLLCPKFSVEIDVPARLFVEELLDPLFGLFVIYLPLKLHLRLHLLVSHFRAGTIQPKQTAPALLTE